LHSVRVLLQFAGLTKKSFVAIQSHYEKLVKQCEWMVKQKAPQLFLQDSSEEVKAPVSGETSIAKLALAAKAALPPIPATGPRQAPEWPSQRTPAKFPMDDEDKERVLSLCVVSSFALRCASLLTSLLLQTAFSSTAQLPDAHYFSKEVLTLAFL